MKYFNYIEAALKKLYELDDYLIKHDVHEQTISCRLAKYLEEEIREQGSDDIKDLNIDCEYNKDRDDIKRFPGQKKGSIRPDIIVHRRGNNDNNFLVIELKKDYDWCDECKINKIVDTFNYKAGYAIQEITPTSFSIYYYDVDQNRKRAKYIVDSNYELIENND